MKKQLPRGLRDYVGAACYNKVRVEQSMLSVCAGYGYERIQPSTLEYFDNFCGAYGSIDAPRMFKLVDTDGQLVVLRPDTTVQLTRIIAHSFPDADVLRFVYLAEGFDLTDGQEREIPQLGAELYGDGSVDADVEILLLALEGCRAAGIDDVIVELGHIDYFYGAADALGLDREQTEQLRVCVTRKDMIGAEERLRAFGADGINAQAIAQLPYLFGGAEVLDRAAGLVTDERSLAALERLRAIYDRMKALGLEDRLVLDLGALRRNNYYSGMMFSVLSGSLGLPLAIGGRYDALCRNYGMDRPAAGLAFWTQRVLSVLEKQGKLLPQTPPTAAVVTDAVSFALAQRESARLRESGACVVRLNGTEQEAEAYCRARGIGTLLVARDGTLVTKEVRRG